MTETLTHSPVDTRRFRRALALHASGVVVVTARNAAGDPVGLTATSFSSVSLDPPLVSFYVAKSSATRPDLAQAEVFAVNLLAAHQVDVAARFARKDVDRFAVPTAWHPGPAGVPLLEEVTAHLLAVPYTTGEIGDHHLVVGLVIGTRTGHGGTPLLYHHGRFGRFLPYSS
ncbi:flavin reductase family protein [Thermomonospora cellulosilytica]|uniref:Flavin reductase (DIM6/NTAB) family NADH-FMN oxidoreductase RutF n=1 Tax=Thermomonospora cellulosilytica TaxID=1411118 RepID=A0A7W3R809_9ACTN|nr:flavin reductase family protein [Thermomonospora cellulosilytica]MBA9002895.1 flavin reductase (DIM6/NTAB) family NADH-FMN oxidoreductase RutF [Thermomonospora cellulosilytica]